MSEYTATIRWNRGEAKFTDNRYSRAHQWEFDGGMKVPGSSSPHSVRVPFSDPAAVDPEEALVAAVSSCHLLSFLYLAAKRGLVVDSYVDHAVGVMEKNAEGKLAVTRVTLRPDIRFASPVPREDIEHLHHEAHEECYIAASVRTEITVEIP
jgi:organic hydroperoxide reductase OsmC/OhrA